MPGWPIASVIHTVSTSSGRLLPPARLGDDRADPLAAARAELDQGMAQVHAAGHAPHQAAALEPIEQHGEGRLLEQGRPRERPDRVAAAGGQRPQHAPLRHPHAARRQQRVEVAQDRVAGARHQVRQVVMGEAGGRPLSDSMTFH